MSKVSQKIKQTIVEIDKLCACLPSGINANPGPMVYRLSHRFELRGVEEIKNAEREREKRKRIKRMVYA
jgi:hypothetical protein